MPKFTIVWGTTGWMTRETTIRADDLAEARKAADRLRREDEYLLRIDEEIAA